MTRLCLWLFAAALAFTVRPAAGDGDLLEVCLAAPQSQFLGFDAQSSPLIARSIGMSPQTRTLVSANGQSPLPTRSEAPIVRAAGSTGALLLFSDAGGNERYRLRYQAPGGEQPIQLSPTGARVASPLTLPSGQEIVYTSTAGEGRLWGVLEYSQSTRNRVLFQEAGAWQVMSSSADGNTILVQEIFGLYDRVLYALDRPTGLKTAIFLGRRPLPIRGGVLSPDGKIAYVLLGNTTREGTVLKIDIYAGKVTRLLKTEWPPYALALSPKGDRLIVLENRNGETWAYSFDPAQSSVGSPQGLGGWAYNPAFAPNGKVFGYTFERPGVGQTAHLQDLSLSRRGVQQGPCAQAAARSIALPRETPVGGIDTLPALLIEPTAPSQRPRPVLLAFHGGPEGQWRKSDHRRFFALAQALNIAILLPNVAGSTGYGLLYSAADDGVRRSAVESDIALILEWIAAEPGYDAGKIGVMGASYGGYLALLAQSKFNAKILGAVSEVGIADLGLFLSETPITRRSLRRAEYGDERAGKIAKALAALSPITHAANITRPVLLIHGRNDARVPVNQSMLMHEALKGQGAPVTLRLLANEGHIIRSPETQLDILRQTQAFWAKAFDR